MPSMFCQVYTKEPLKISPYQEVKVLKILKDWSMPLHSIFSVIKIFQDSKNILKLVIILLFFENK